MQTFRTEVRTILSALRGCPWATHPEVGEVIAEYEHFEGAARTPTQNRRVSLQIFHASRAIDSLLEHMVQHEQTRTGRRRSRYVTLGGALGFIQRRGIGGSRFSTMTEPDVVNLKDDRNEYMHNANLFPTDGQIRRFLNRTIRAIGEASAFPQ